MRYFTLIGYLIVYSFVMFTADKLRITSYNVCYTKLLREMASMLSAIFMVMAVMVCLMSIFIIFTSFKVIVITSYSIHYTKLYELFKAGAFIREIGTELGNKLDYGYPLQVEINVENNA